ncbi:PhoH family protein [Gemmatimonas phototrophica]|nr:PhoH family protein [Gemmatimonas phototrophica]
MSDSRSDGRGDRNGDRVEVVTARVSVEGADLQMLAGVNDGNLKELERATGARVALRGDHLSLTGDGEAIARAESVAAALVAMVRDGKSVSADDVLRLSLTERPADTPGATSGGLVLPGSRRGVQAKTAGQAEYLKKIGEHDIVVGIGPAGTGKTYLAVAAAVDALMRKRVRRIVLARPAVEAGESLGFLPGDMQAKIDPYLRPLYDALDDLIPFERIQKLIESRTIEVAPLAFMRGRTLGDSFVILDEAQNATGAQMKMFLTRLGVNSKIVITGDKTQVDLPRREDSGLMQIERILHGIEGISFHYFSEADVVRHRLVRDIIRAYNEDAAGGG